MIQIPVENIYFLLCYAWDKLEERDLVQVDDSGSTDLLDLFARVLVNGTNHLLKRGFDRGYLLHREETKRLRGKVLFSPSIQRNLFIQGRAACEFDEFSYNVLHNRILKTTLSKLRRYDGLAGSSREQLRKVLHRLHEIQEIEVTSRSFLDVQLHRNNAFYEFLMRICEFIHEQLLPSEKQGARTFRNFLQDEVKMRLLFEAFVRNFYRHHLADFDVSAEAFRWNLEASEQGCASLLPMMRTDVTLESKKRKIIIDCKYTAAVFDNQYGAPKFKTDHMYQLHTYLTQSPPASGRKLEAILLYPVVSDSVRAEYRDPEGRRFAIRTINLNQHRSKIHEELIDLIR